jgi:uncharacterized protein (TIGR02265 family)
LAAFEARAAKSVSEHASTYRPSLKGLFFQARVEYVTERHGYEALARVLDALPGTDRQHIEGLDRDGWYPFGTLNALDRCIASTLEPGDPGLFERLGAAAAKHRTELLGRDARLVNVHAFLSRVADEHAQLHSFGRLAYERLGFTEGEIRASGFPELDEVYCQGSRGYLKASVQHLTGGPVEASEVLCQCHGASVCAFQLRWSRAEGH